MPNAKGSTTFRYRGGFRGRSPSNGVYLPLDVFQAVDRRSAVSKDLIYYRDSFLSGLGGPDNVSPQQRVLIERAAVLTVKVKLLEGALLSGSPTFPDQTYLAYVGHLRRLLETIGLVRVAKHMGVIDTTSPHAQALKALEAEPVHVSAPEPPETPEPAP